MEYYPQKHQISMYMACIVYLEFSWQGDYLLSRPDTYIARALSSGDPQPPDYKHNIYVSPLRKMMTMVKMAKMEKLRPELMIVVDASS